MFIKERDKSLNTSRYVTFRAGMKEHVMYRKTGGKYRNQLVERIRKNLDLKNDTKGEKKGQNKLEERFMVNLDRKRRRWEKYGNKLQKQD